MRSSNPFVINRDVMGREHKVLIDVSEYDGMLEDVDVKPLNRLTAINAIHGWERDFDHITDNEYDIIFRIAYRRSPNQGGEKVSIEYAFTHSDNVRVADWEKVEDQIAITLDHLNEPMTEVTDLEIYGPTARKMWYRVSTEIVDFTPV